MILMCGNLINLSKLVLFNSHINKYFDNEDAYNINNIVHVLLWTYRTSPWPLIGPWRWWKWCGHHRNSQPSPPSHRWYSPVGRIYLSLSEDNKINIKTITHVHLCHYLKEFIKKKPKTSWNNYISFCKKKKKKINHTNAVKHVYSEVPGMGNFAWL